VENRLDGIADLNSEAKTFYKFQNLGYTQRQCKMISYHIYQTQAWNMGISDQITKSIAFSSEGD